MQLIPIGPPRAVELDDLDDGRAFRPDAAGAFEAELLDGARVPASRARAKELRKLGR